MTDEAISNIDRILERNGFHRAIKVSGMRSIDGFIRDRDATGIYVLHISDGFYYVGQSIDIRKRFAQHIQSLKFPSISRIFSKKVLKKDLYSEENKIIHILSNDGVKLYNKDGPTYDPVESSYSILISKEDQTKWINGGVNVINEEDRPNQDIQRQRYSSKFAIIQKKKYFNEFHSCLNSYIRNCIYMPHLTEFNFWSVSCLPRINRDIVIYGRVNIFRQEVATFFESPPSDDDNEEGFFMSFGMRLSPLEEWFKHNKNNRINGSTLRYKKKLCLNMQQELFGNKNEVLIECDDFIYKPGGVDQIRMTLCDYKCFHEFIEHPAIKKAIRLLNVELMRKGGNFYSSSHCYQLADTCYSY